MKTNEQMLEDLLKRKEAYDKKRAARRRRAALISAALAIILIVSSIPIIAFVANKKTPELPEVTGEVVTDEAIITDATTTNITENDDAGTAFVSNTETENKEGIAYAPGSKFHYGFIVDYYEKDKTEPIVLSKEQYGRQKWLNKEIIKQYEMDLPIWDVPDDHDYIRYNDSFYGYAKTGDIYELEIKLKNTNEWVGDEYLLRVEADDSVEILSDVIYRGVFPTVNDPTWSLDPGDYISLPLRFRFTGDTKWTDFRIYIFVRSSGNEYHGAHDRITEAEEYFAQGYSMADKAYLDWRENNEFNPLRSSAANHYEARFIEIKGYDFLLDSGTIYGTTELYERAALFFGDVDENGVPLFITNPDMSDYSNPCRIPMLLDIPGYNTKLKKATGGTNSASSGLFRKSNKVLNSKGDVIKQYHIELSGYINWSINDDEIYGLDDGLRPAKDVAIIIYNTSNPAISPEIVKYTYTDSFGHYSFSFNTFAVEPFDLRVDVVLSKNNLKVSDFDSSTVFQTIKTECDIPINASYTASYNFLNSVHGSTVDNKNREVSAFQSAMLAYNYIQSIQDMPSNPYDELTVLLYDSNYTYYYSNDRIINLSYRNAFDWDVSQHEFGHYVEDLFGFFYWNPYDEHDLITNLLSNHYKEEAIQLAWSEGWATFFAINAQRIMDAISLNVPYVGDYHYNNTEEPIVNGISQDIDVDIEYLIDYQNYATIYLGETNEATVAALLFDLVDGINMDDVDITCISDSIIWSIIIGDETDPNDGCVSLSGFLKAFQETTLLTGGQKIVNMYLLGRYELNPYNLSVTNVSSGSPLVTWTNISANCYNRIRVFDTSFNEICSPIFISYQTSYNIPAATWNQIKSGRTAVYIVVEGMNSSYPITAYYYSSPIHVSIP